MDEIPHPRALLSLRALYSIRDIAEEITFSTNMVYKLSPIEFMYDFNCHMELRGDILSSGAAAATTVGYAKQFVHLEDANKNQFISRVRMHQQTLNPYPFQNVLYPGSFHVTFFGGAERIKNKLESYSHQNFVRQFLSVVDSDSCRVEFSNDAKQLESCLNGSVIYDANTGAEVIPKQLPNGVISTEKITVFDSIICINFVCLPSLLYPTNFTPTYRKK